MIEAEQIMKRCQAGTRNYEEANNLHAACYGMIGKLLAQRTWVGLTNDEVNAATPVIEEQILIRVMEAKLKDKNCVG
jgi:hypothetical protein